jgi:hypothetical protein
MAIHRPYQDKKRHKHRRDEDKDRKKGQHKAGSEDADGYLGDINDDSGNDSGED